eukprot:TRINITY_DN73686_c0_g1_i1.p1 TRINITY_DN73686_c0_g1~~TRINITY_DN73686_c0_g1_i1.p1  ORF type:complete len:109 (-),score=27.48 TRINITY_DN73686_c0_g1_i1:77-403(-)
MQRAVIAVFFVVLWWRGFTKDDTEEISGGYEKSISKLLGQFDTDGNEKISLDEALTGLKLMSPDDTAFFEQNVPVVFKEVDDGDNFLSETEFEKFFEVLSEAFDTADL